MKTLPISFPKYYFLFCIKLKYNSLNQFRKGRVLMVEMCTLVHNDYDRISDKVMWLGFGVTLNFNIDLFFQRKNNNTNEKIKENFHREYLYKTNPNDISYRVKVIRDFNYYFSIEYNTKDIKDRVVIGPEHIYFLIFNLKKVIQWFIGEDGINTIFSKKDGKIFIPTHPEPIKVNLAFDNYIEFIVITNIF